MQTADVLHIPPNGDPPKIVNLDLITASIAGYANEESWKAEDHLIYVPDVTSYEHWVWFGWRHRSLVDLGNLDGDPTPEEQSRVRGPYFMYRCSKESHFAVPNDHFKGVEGAAKVYGDVFIFKVTKPGDDEVVRYERLTEDFLKGGFKGKGVVDEETLKWLANQ